MSNWHKFMKCPEHLVMNKIKRYLNPYLDFLHLEFGQSFWDPLCKVNWRVLQHPATFTHLHELHFEIPAILTAALCLLKDPPMLWDSIRGPNFPRNMTWKRWELIVWCRKTTLSLFVEGKQIRKMIIDFKTILRSLPTHCITGTADKAIHIFPSNIGACLRAPSSSSSQNSCAAGSLIYTDINKFNLIIIRFAGLFVRHLYIRKTFCAALELN